MRRYNRPAFKQMMQDIESGKVKHIVCYRLDRISRSMAVGEPIAIGCSTAWPVAEISSEVVVVGDALCDGFPFQLGEGHNNVDHGTAQWVGSVKVFGG